MARPMPNAQDIRKAREQAAKAVSERAEIIKTPLLAALGVGEALPRLPSTRCPRLVAGPPKAARPPRHAPRSCRSGSPRCRPSSAGFAAG